MCHPHGGPNLLTRSVGVKNTVDVGVNDARAVQRRGEQRGGGVRAVAPERDGLSRGLVHGGEPGDEHGPVADFRVEMGARSIVALTRA